MTDSSSPSLPPRRGVAVVVLREERLLVIRRSAIVRAPGAYCFPGGHIEAEESESDAVIRELTEELAITVAPVRRLWQNVTPWGVELAWWLAELPADAIPNANLAEVESWHWLTLDEMLALPELLASNREFIEALRSGMFVLGRRGLREVNRRTDCQSV